MTSLRRLREATRDEHARVDAAYARCDLGDRASYAAFLHAHACALGAAEPAVAPDLPRLPLLLDDLAALGVAPPSPLPFDAPTSGAARWGMRYTLEGSRLGGAYLARNVADGLPKAYLSATHAPDGWRAFTAALDGAVTEEASIEQAIAAARAVFGLFRTAAAELLSEADAAG